MKEGEERNDNVLSPLVTGESLYNSRTAGDSIRRTIEPQNPSDVHLLIQRDTSSEVDKFEHSVQNARLLGRPLASVSMGQREGCGFWRRDCAENVWCVGDLGPEDSTVRGVVGLDQELHRIGLCGNCSIMRHGISTRARKRMNRYQKDPRLGTR